MNFIKIWYIATLSFIGLSYSNPTKQSEVVFDITKLNSSNFTIYEKLDATIGGKTTYQFVPKAGTKVVKIKHADSLLWKKVDENSVEDITLLKSIATSYFYTVGLVNNENKKNYLYYKVFFSLFDDSGLAEHFHGISNSKLSVQTFKKFDINSTFDHRYFEKKHTFDYSEVLTILEFKSHNLEYIDIVSDGPTELYHDKKIELITLTQKKSENYLMKLKTTSYTYVYFQYDTKWKRINQEEYNNLLPKEIKTIDFGKYSSPKVTDNKLDIAGKNKTYSQDNNKYLTVPTLIHNFEDFLELYDGSELIYKEPIKRARIMVYRGKTTNQLIEIIHTIRRRLGETDDSNDEINGKHPNLGKLNIYFIRKENKWTRCDQLEFLNNFKMLAISNLEEYNAKAQRRIAELNNVTTNKWSAGAEKDNLNEQIVKNKKGMEVISSFKLRDTIHRKEITVDSFTEREKSDTKSSKDNKPKNNEREEPIPKKEPVVNSETPKKPKHQGEFHDEWKMVPYTRGDEFGEPRENPIEPEDTSNVGETGSSNVGKQDTSNTEKPDTSNEEMPPSKDSVPEKKKKPIKFIDEKLPRPWNPIKPNEVLNKPEPSKGTVKKNVSEADGQLRSGKAEGDKNPKEVKKSENTSDSGKKEKAGFYTQSFLLFLPILFLIT